MSTGHLSADILWTSYLCSLHQARGSWSTVKTVFQVGIARARLDMVTDRLSECEHVWFSARFSVPQPPPFTGCHEGLYFQEGHNNSPLHTEGIGRLATLPPITSFCKVLSKGPYGVHRDHRYSLKETLRYRTSLLCLLVFGKNLPGLMVSPLVILWRTFVAPLWASEGPQLPHFSVEFFKENKGSYLATLLAYTTFIALSSIALLLPNISLSKPDKFLAQSLWGIHGGNYSHF